MDERSSGFALPIEIAYQPPFWLLPYLFVTSISAIVCVLISDLSWLLRLLLVITIVLLALREGRQIRHDQTGIRLDVKDCWFVIDAQGKGLSASLWSATITLPGFIVLVLQTADNRRYSFILTSVGQDSTVMRRLRTRLIYPLRAGERG